jgi:peptide/nickel transport system permease protein
MGSYVIRRILLMFVTLLGITLVSFTMTALAPGDRMPEELGGGQAEAGLRGADIQRKREQFIQEHHLDAPVIVRYLHWLGKTITLSDKSWAVKKGVAVRDLIVERVGASIQYNLISLVLVYLIALPLGTMQALNRNTFWDYLTTVLTLILYSIPTYAVGTLIVVYFCSKQYFNVFPIGLNHPGEQEMTFFPFLADRLWRLTPAVITATYGGFAYLSKLQRGALLETLRADYVRTAWAKGLSPGRVIVRHAIRNSLLPLITVAAAILPAMIGGSVIIETVFSIKGIGLMSYEAVLHRDEPVVMAMFVTSGFLMLLSLLIVDLLYAKADPRISYA